MHNSTFTNYLAGQLFLIFVACLIINPARGQIAPDVCTSATVVTVGSCNQTFNLQAGAASTADSCFTSLGDGWAQFTPTNTAPVIIQYSTQDNLDAAITVYRGSCTNGDLVQCTNEVLRAGTESVAINAQAGTTYFIKVMNLENNGLALNGSLCLFNGLEDIADLCSQAQDLAIGTCGVELNLESSLFNNESRSNPCSGKTLQTDTWRTFDLSIGQQINIEYLTAAKDAGIALYSGVCGTLVLEACSDDVTGAGTEKIEYLSTSNGTFYLQIMNLEDQDALAGNICISETRSRDDCAAAAAAPDINLNDCNLRFDVLASYGFDGANSTCGGVANNADAWLTYTAPADANLVFDYLSTNSGLPDVLVYDATTFTCASGVAPLACQGNGGNSFNSLAFSVLNGRTYYIRVISSNGNDMEGLACLSEAGKQPGDNFYDSQLLLVDGSDCGFPFLVNTSLNSDGGLPLANPSEGSCGGTILSDAWASFQLTGPDTLIIEYDNNNSSISSATNVALSVFKGPRIDTFNYPAPNQYLQNNCKDLAAINTIPANTVVQNIPIGNGGSDLDSDFSVGNFDLLFNYDNLCNGFPLDPVSGDIWTTYDAVANEPFYVNFVTASPDDFIIEVYKGADCDNLTAITTEALAPNPGDGCLRATNDGRILVSPLATERYYIRLLNLSASAITGDLFIYTGLRELSCQNLVDEGIETFTLIETSTPVDSLYYIRVADLGPAPSQGITGNLCIKPPVKDRDLCSTAENFNNGGCSSDFGIPSDFDQNENIPDPSCVSGVLRDAWASFTATSDNYTLEFSHQGTDAALAVYQGSCQSLTLISCENSINTDGLESMKFDTEIGILYYVRIMNVGSDVAITGSLCIRETEESDVCDVTQMERINVGDCNIRFDVPAAFSNTGTSLLDVNGGTASLPSQYQGADPLVAPSFTCDPNLNASGTPGSNAPRIPQRDSWISMVGNGSVVTLQYQNNHDGLVEISDPAIVVYTALLDQGPINCGVGINGAGNVGNEYACSDLEVTSSRQTEQVTFQSSPGRVYFIRVMDMDGSTGMSGTLCLSEGDQDNDICTEADTIEIGDCSVQLNVVPDPGGCSTLPPGEDCGSITCQSDAWAVIQTPVDSIPENNITVEYDNSGSSEDLSSENVDIALAIYDGTCGALTLIDTPGCVDDLSTGEAGIERINFAAEKNRTYFIRVINKTANATAFGRMCVFYGEDIAEEECSTPALYGDLNGEWKSFNVPEEWNTQIVPTTTIEDPPCVIESASIPATSTPLIKSQAWFQFRVPAGSSTNFSAVTIQYDNLGLVDGNPQNAAIAVYINPNEGLPGNPDCTISSGFFGDNEYDPADHNQPNGLHLVQCSNAVWEGIESMTIPVLDTRTYYVRVMNLSSQNPAQDMPGRIRVFPFVACDIGEELVIDGNFENWNALDDSSAPSITATQYSDMDNWEHPIPDFVTYGTDQTVMNSYARFATDYGYLRDQGAVNGDATQANLWSQRTEMRTEGLYSVTHTAWNYKRNWFCYGHGYSGYGGGLEGETGEVTQNLDPSYCASGPGVNTEACVEVPYYRGGFTQGTFGTPSTGLPALIPTEADANFMLVNGWFPDLAQYDPGKIWCQTIERDDPSRIGFFVFTAWFQNVKSPAQSGELPQLRVTVCDMEDPQTGDVSEVPADWASITSATGINSLLPGTTKTPGGIPNPDNSIQTIHVPEPPANANMTLPAPRSQNSFAFGAAMPCNADGEAPNARLKVLGSSFFLEQNPDRWQILYCIYRAPIGVRELNICIENQSITKNGNDFAIDDISFRECVDPDVSIFENLLRGGGCQLADTPDDIIPALNLQLMDFQGRMIDEQVVLSWVSLGETAGAYFEVQKSVDGQNFRPIGKKEPGQNDGNLANYVFFDSDLPRETSFVYYRLKMVNAQGASQLSSVIRVLVSRESILDFKIQPNPVKHGESTSLQFSGISGKGYLMLTDLMGNRLDLIEVQSASEENQVLDFDTKNLPPGIYILKLQIAGKSATQRLVVL